eukprot:scaffold28303_cov17-Tisochrysis_lutea.AAC.1
MKQPPLPLSRQATTTWLKQQTWHCAWRRKSHVLAVSFTPDPNPGESDADYQSRVQEERVLTLHEGFNPDP